MSYSQYYREIVGLDLGWTWGSVQGVYCGLCKRPCLGSMFFGLPEIMTVAHIWVFGRSGNVSDELVGVARHSSFSGLCRA